MAIIEGEHDFSWYQMRVREAERIDDMRDAALTEAADEGETDVEVLPQHRDWMVRANLDGYVHAFLETRTDYFGDEQYAASERSIYVRTTPEEVLYERLQSIEREVRTDWDVASQKDLAQVMEGYARLAYPHFGSPLQKSYIQRVTISGLVQPAPLELSEPQADLLGTLTKRVGIPFDPVKNRVLAPPQI